MHFLCLAMSLDILRNCLAELKVLDIEGVILVIPFLERKRQISIGEIKLKSQQIIAVQSKWIIPPHTGVVCVHSAKSQGILSWDGVADRIGHGRGRQFRIDVLLDIGIRHHRFVNLLSVQQ